MIRALATAALIALGTPAAAQGISFNDWRDQRFQLFSRVDFGKAGGTLTIRADDAASMIYRLLPQSAWDARAASWSWTVQQSVPPTPLNQRGGDDRNIAVYFAFLPRDQAQALGSNANIRSMLNDPQGRVLVYVHGGAGARGAMMRTPYFDDRGVVVIRRPAGTGPAMERVDLAADYARAFGEEPGALVALAVSADSDDTDSVIEAQLTGLTLR